MSKYGLTWGGTHRHIINEGYKGMELRQGEARAWCGLYVIPEPWAGEMTICIQCLNRRDKATT